VNTKNTRKTIEIDPNTTDSKLGHPKQATL
jgi:hypothetical protein